MRELTFGASLAWDIAVRETALSGYIYIQKEHMLIAILSLDKLTAIDPEEAGLGKQDWDSLKLEYNMLNRILGKFNLDMTRLRREIRSRLNYRSQDLNQKIFHRDPDCKAIFKRAEEISPTSEKTSSIHLFSAVLEAPGTIIEGTFTHLGIAISRLLEESAIEMAENNKRENLKIAGEDKGENKTRFFSAQYLDRYSRDLTREAREGKLGPFFGRRKELLQIIQTMARSSKNNPVLVGEAGVGKTAIVEALAVRIIQGKDPDILSGKRIVELNIGQLEGGTKYRGDFEERLTRIIEEVRAHPDVIIFIDEIHTLIGAGRAEGSLDAANILKPALAKGDFPCIGATTNHEYRRYIESDPALERRFEKINIDEPSRDETLEILSCIRPKWEKHHGLKISDPALEAAVDLSIRFDTDHRLPDKAIDLVDRAGSRTRIPVLSMTPGPSIQGNTQPEAAGSNVTEQVIAQVLSEKTGVPVEIIAANLPGARKSSILGLESYLKMHLVGQDKAIEQVSKRLNLAFSGISNRRGPLAVFLFLGPTGVGKTELAKTMNRFLFGDSSKIIRLDMSEFMEEHSVSKLIGSPPGYVGYEEEGKLTGLIRTRPYSIVLLDEVEKAHYRVLDLFLQVFDEGRLTDSKGRTVDARNAIFIMTSNIGLDTLEAKTLGFQKTRVADIPAEILAFQEIKKYFRAELINRIDEQVVFRQLSETDVKMILNLWLDDTCRQLESQHQIVLDIEEEAKDFIVRQGFSPQYGVRELRRTVELLVQMPLSSLSLSGKFQDQNCWKLQYQDERLSFIPQ